MLTNKKAYYYFTDNDEYANMADKMYTEKGYLVEQICSLDVKVTCLSFKNLLLTITPDLASGGKSKRMAF